MEKTKYCPPPNLQQPFTQNFTLKCKKSQKHQQLQSLLTNLQQLSVQHTQAKMAYMCLKQANKQIQKCQQMIDKISSKLVERQVLSNCSADYRKMIKMYQQKIHQYRLQIHTKERNYQEYYWGCEGDDHDDHVDVGKIAQQYVGPQAHHVRKFNIQLLYKQKIQKLLLSLSQLNNTTTTPTPKPLHKPRRCNTQDLYNPTPKQIKQTSNELQNRKQLRVVANLMYDCVQQQMNRSKQLSQKYMIYKNVLEIVSKQNYKLVVEIRHKGSRKWGAGEEEVREMKESVVIV